MTSPINTPQVHYINGSLQVNTSCILRRSDGVDIGVVTGKSIERACNSHAALVEALEDTRKTIRLALDDVKSGKLTHDQIFDLLIEINGYGIDALTQAKG